MKRVLGLDIGTNSIGSALIELPDNFNDYGTDGKIVWMGSRIIPTDTNLLTHFEKGEKLNSGTGTGASQTPATARRGFRSARRVKQRYILRRTRLIKTLKVIGWLDASFPEDFKEYFKLNDESKYRISDFLSFSDETVKEATRLLGVDYKASKKRTASQKARTKVYDGLVVPEDWIVWYLRKKALTERITKFELARVLYMMNQRRGFKSSRKDFREKGEQNVQREWVELVTILSVEEDTEFEPGKDRKKKYNLIGKGEESGREYRWEIKRYNAPEWQGKSYTLLLTEKFDEKKNTWKFLTPQKPKDDDWELQMVSLDNQIEKSEQHPGEFFFDKLATDKNFKIRQQVVKRARYQKELAAIWEAQTHLWGKDSSSNNPLLTDNTIIERVAYALYPKQSEFKGPKYRELRSNDLLNVVSNDIIYYQRELKSQKDSISGCQYEKLHFIPKNEKGEKKNARTVGRKVAPKSSPEFQEYRIWQDISNLRIIQNEHKEDGKTTMDRDVTEQYLTPEVKAELFEMFDSSEKVTEVDVLRRFKLFVETPRKAKKSEQIKVEQPYRINMFENRAELQGNLTKAKFRKVFEKLGFQEGLNNLNGTAPIDYDFVSKLWHIIYSIAPLEEGEKNNGRRNALLKWLHDTPNIENIANALSVLPDFKLEYASLSHRAIEKLLPLMRCGSHWSWNAVPAEIQNRIDGILASDFKLDKDTDSYVDKKTGEIADKNTAKFIRHELDQREKFQGLPVWMSAYVVYGRHSEKKTIEKYTKPEDIDIMRLVPNKAFNNPIVEKVLRETLCIVSDLWKVYGQPDEIHVELARELKKNAKERKNISERNVKDREEKEHIRSILRELLGDPYAFEGNRPNPDAPKDVEKFRLWMQQASEKPESLYEPSSGEVQRYRLWLEQKCFSPYTLKPIPLARLFTDDYDVDHILPKSKIKYDSMENLVVAETYVNRHVKGGRLAFKFIEEFGGREFNGYTILTPEKYEAHCRSMFSHPSQRNKLRNLLRDDIPEDFVSRQLNDTRHITRKAAQFLSPIAKRKEGVVFTGGSITSDLKLNWGLNEIWKEMLRPRFERLERLTGNQMVFERTNDRGQTILDLRVPDQPDFELKRIDHRHHALDALIIAATTREHVRYLNSLNAADTNEEIRNVRRALVKGKIRDFKLPWQEFCRDARISLQSIIVSVKQAKNPITVPKNKYQKWEHENGKWVKKFVEQKSNPKWLAVRRSMFKQPQGVILLKKKRVEKNLAKVFEVELNYMKAQDTPGQRTAAYIYDKEARVAIRDIIFKTDGDLAAIKKHLKANGLIDTSGGKITEVQIAEFEEYASKRVTVDGSFSEDKIDKIPYAAFRREENRRSPLADTLREHLLAYGGKKEVAFVGEGKEALDKKLGRPIGKVTIFEKSSSPKYGNAFVESDNNPYFVIFENRATRSRSDKGNKMRSMSIVEAVNRKLQGLPVVEGSEGYKIILLSGDDFVYVPTANEITNPSLIQWSDVKKLAPRIYRVAKFTGTDCYFQRHDISKLILDNKSEQGELGTQNYLQTMIDVGEEKSYIKNICIKVWLDRLGNVRPLDQ